MTNLADEALLSHIVFLEDAVRRLDLHHESVQSSLANAQIALDSARRAVTILTTHDTTLRAHRLSLAKDLDAQRLALERSRSESKAARAQKIMAGFPSELLRAIFLRAFESVNNVWRDEDHLSVSYNPDDRRVPFALAAVNRQWRTVALDTPVIWSFVGVPSLEDPVGDGLHQATLSFVETLLHRSTNHDLDVFLDWFDGQWDMSPATYGTVLHALGRHAHRWRRVSIKYPSYTKEDAIQALRLPMPRLEHLAVSLSSLLSLSSAGYLSSCRRLRHLSNYGLHAVPPRSLDQVIFLDLTVFEFLPDVVWDTLRLLPVLEQLFIGFRRAESWDFYEAVPQERLALPHLRKLGFSGALCSSFSSWIPALDMPRLTVLDIDQTVLLPSLIPSLENSTTATLVIRNLKEWNSIMHDHIDAIRRLRDLKHVVFRNCMFISPILAYTFRSREVAGLPRLESVAFEEPRLDEEHASRLSNLMYALHSNPNDNIAFSLTTDSNSSTVPEWLLQQYSALTAAKSYV